MTTVAHGNVIVISSRLVTTDEYSFGGVDDSLFATCPKRNAQWLLNYFKVNRNFLTSDTRPAFGRR